jgi:hypothetical protein
MLALRSEASRIKEKSVRYSTWMQSPYHLPSLVFWDITPCILAKVNQRFGKPITFIFSCCLHYAGFDPKQGPDMLATFHQTASH